MAEKRFSLVILEAINLKNTGLTRKLFLQWRFAEIFTAIFSFSGILSATADYEFGFSPERTHENCKMNTIEVHRYMTTIFTLIAMFFLILRHKLKSRWRNKRPVEYYSKYFKSTLFKSFISKRLLLELFILAIFPYPHFSQDFRFMQSTIWEKNEDISYKIVLCYNWTEFMYIFMYMRLFFIIRAVFNFTPYQDDHARYYCSKFKSRSNFRFSIRCMMKTHPFLIIYGGSCFSFVTLGIFLRVFERPFTDVSGINYESFQNSIWNSAVTMSTLGYGDLYPTTLFGRAVGVVCALWGAFVFSMIVFTFQSLLQLDHQQKLAFSSIKQTRGAAHVIVASLLYSVTKKKYGKNSSQAKIAWKNLMKILKKFETTMRRLKRVDTYIEEADQSKKFYGLFKEVSAMDKNIDILLKRKMEVMK